MNGFPYQTGGYTYHSITLVTEDDRTGRQVARFLTGAGQRLGNVHRLEDVEPESLNGSIWVELEGAGRDALPGWLARLRDSGTLGPSTVVVPHELLDLVVAMLDEPKFDILVDPDDTERATGVALLDVRGRQGGNVRDVSGRGDDERLRQLSDEVARIAATLARLSGSPANDRGYSSDKPASSSDPIPHVGADVVRAAIRARRLREQYFKAELFADPAWDMLLDLLAAEIAQHRVPVSSLCIAASVPATTALRWMKTMTDEGLFLRRADPHDGRRVFIELAPHASEAMRRYFGALQGNVAA